MIWLSKVGIKKPIILKKINMPTKLQLGIKKRNYLKTAKSSTALNNAILTIRINRRICH